MALMIIFIKVLYALQRCIFFWYSILHMSIRSNLLYHFVQTIIIIIFNFYKTLSEPNWYMPGNKISNTPLFKTLTDFILTACTSMRSWHQISQQQCEKLSTMPSKFWVGDYFWHRILWLKQSSMMVNEACKNTKRFVSHAPFFGKFIENYVSTKQRNKSKKMKTCDWGNGNPLPERGKGNNSCAAGLDSDWEEDKLPGKV